MIKVPWDTDARNYVPTSRGHPTIPEWVAWRLHVRKSGRPPWDDPPLWLRPEGGDDA